MGPARKAMTDELKFFYTKVESELNEMLAKTETQFSV